MILSAICKKAGYTTRLGIVARENLIEILDDFRPDVIAYSTMTSDENSFAHANDIIQAWSKDTGHPVKRIMGGPHPTYFPNVIHKLNLDAICAGDGERAIISMLEAIQDGRSMEKIPNVTTPNAPMGPKEVIEDMNINPYNTTVDQADATANSSAILQIESLLSGMSAVLSGNSNKSFSSSSGQFCFNPFAT